MNIGAIIKAKIIEGELNTRNEIKRAYDLNYVIVVDYLVTKVGYSKANCDLRELDNVIKDVIKLGYIYEIKKGN